MKEPLRLLLSFIALVISFAFTAQAQTTAFTYQGRLSDGANAANGSYPMQFALFDAAAALCGRCKPEQSMRPSIRWIIPLITISFASPASRIPRTSD